jgi:hypothetical protein
MKLLAITLGGRLRFAQVFAIFALLPGAMPAADLPVQKFLDAYCVSCHDSATKKGGLDLEKLSTDFKDQAAFDLWVKIHDRIRSGEMPPKARKERPEQAEAEAIVKRLEAGLSEAERARRAADGRAVFRRLNRTEYENTVRDLFGLPGLKVKELLPEDGRAFGFDKSAAGLDLSYVQLSKYMEVADFALDAAIAPHASRPIPLKGHIPGGGHDLYRNAFGSQTVFLKNFKYDSSIIPVPTERLTKDDDAKVARANLLKHPYDGSMGVITTERQEFRPKLDYSALYEGRYKIRMSLWGFLWDKGEVRPNPQTEIASLVVDGQTLGFFDAPSLKPMIHEIEVWLTPMASQKGQIQFNAASLRGYSLNGDLTAYVGPGIAVDWVDIEGPIIDQWPPASHRRLFGDLPFVPLEAAAKPKPKAKKKGKDAGEDSVGNIHVPQRPAANAFTLIKGHGKVYITNAGSFPKTLDYSTVASKAPEADAARLLADFLPRAFRRPVSSDEVGEYVNLFKNRLADGDLFEMAMRRTYRAALCSPDFLFLKETPGRLDSWALASRLSYFLWNSMPDDTLTALAGKDRLHDPAVLREQVERMLKDPKAERFAADFTDQWLDLRDIDDTTPDRKLYPGFRRILRDSVLAESRAFWRELLENDLPTSNIVHSDFAMLNQRLGEHYRITGIDGSAIRRVPLPADSHRGGFLTQAAILKVTANGTTTSPVRRGAWVQRKIVGQPPEPPPPNVPAIEPDVQGATTIRELLVKHRTNATCAACHAKIDPPGFALENFDVTGNWQTRYRSLGEGDEPDAITTGGRKVLYKLAQKVDPSGETADGRPFADIDAFKKLLLADSRQIARNLVSQMVVYATGAPVGFADRAAVEQVLTKTASNQHGVRSLVHEIVQSPLFQTK